MSSDTVTRVLQIISVSAIILTGLLCMNKIKTREINVESLECNDLQFPNTDFNGYGSSIFDAVIRENINVPNDIDYQHNILDIMDQQKMCQKHAANMRYLNESSLKPILLIIEPAELLFDPQLITITDNINGTELNVTSFTKIIREYNKDTLWFALGSDGSDKNQIYALRPKLIYFISWLHRLSLTFGVKFEIVAYSSILNNIQLISQLNLIQIYYNVLIGETKDISNWFKFIGGITQESYLKTLQNVGSVFPFQDYQLVVVIDTDKDRWNISDNFKNIIGIEAQAYNLGILQGTLKNIISLQSSDNYLSLLLEVLKKFITSTQYRSVLSSKITAGSSFWNVLTFNGNMKTADL